MTYREAVKIITGSRWKRGRDPMRDAALYWIGHHLRLRIGAGLKP